MRPRRFGWSASIALAMVSFGFGGAAFAQAPAGAPPAAPPAEPAPPAAAPMPMAPPAPDASQPPAAYVPVTPVIATPAPAPPSMAIPLAPALKIENAVGTLRLGLLLQPQFESLGAVSGNGYANNLYLRRARILAGGTLFGTIDYFVETDSANAFKGATAVPTAGQALKTTTAMVIQDAFATAKPMGDMLKVDVGYMLPPLSHNAIQGAGTLFGWDYFAYTFQHSNAFGAATAPVGRDLGFQVRGLVVDGHIEYRAGLFQGQRNAAVAAVPMVAPADQSARNFFRAAARVQINVFDAEPGFFYAGTYLGAKKILSFGGSYDFQSDYKSFSFDGILDMPLGPGVVTGQVDYSHWNGGTYLAELPKQWTVEGEAGYTFLPVKVAPIVRIEHLSTVGAAGATTRYAGGLAYWCYGHNSNVKLFYSRIQQNEALHGANQINLQWQVYFF